MTVSLVERIKLKQDLPAPEVRRRLRENVGLTLAEVADAVGVTLQAISSYELGRRTPRGKELERYVEALRVMRAASWKELSVEEAAARGGEPNTAASP